MEHQSDTLNGGDGIPRNIVGANGDDGAPMDVGEALAYLQLRFPVEKFSARLPPIVIRYQLYSLLPDRALVHRQLTELQKTGEIRLIKNGTDADSCYIVSTDQYRLQILRHANEAGLSPPQIERFLSIVSTPWKDFLVVNKREFLQKYHISEQDISLYIESGLLRLDGPNSWTPAIPCIGVFTKTFNLGRKAILTVVKRSKNHEILQGDLECRKLPRVARLGSLYHVHDIIGAGLVRRVETESGHHMLVLCDTQSSANSTASVTSDI
jgi:serine/threonine-protein kinase 19